MKIAIHPRINSFSDGWIKYCKDNNIQYKLVNAYDSDIVSKLQDCDAFMWHHHHNNPKDILFAKQLLYSLEISGKKVFPNFSSGWHFDDKVGQKYLFESIGAPLVPSYTFYSKEDAIKWIKDTKFPKVFKLRGGAGASNVILVKTKKQAFKLTKKAFGKGFPNFNYYNNITETFKQYKNGNSKSIDVLRSIKLYIKELLNRNKGNRQKGYIYFQDFIPNNDTDTRIVVVGDKIIGERRGCRKDDFRASGSHILLPDISKVDVNCVKVAYQISQKLKLQTGVFDFVHDKNNNPLIVEISYGTMPDYTECEGYWDNDFIFHKAKINLPEIIIESFLNSSIK